jgi:hypothetical protein
LTDSNSALSLGRYGRNRVRQRFAWQRIVEDYEAMLAELGSLSTIR